MFLDIQNPPNIQKLINTELLVQKNELQKIKPLSKAEIFHRLQTLPNWEINNNQLTYSYEFENFVEAINFVTCLVSPTETANHHQANILNFVNISLLKRI